MPTNHRKKWAAGLTIGLLAALPWASGQSRGQTPAAPPQSGVVSEAPGNPYQRAGQLPARILDFTAQPSSIQPGQSVTLVWGAENPSGVTIDPGIGIVTARGSRRVTPAATTTYTLTVRGVNNTVLTRAVTVNVAGTTPVAPSPAPDQTAGGKKPVPRTADGKPDLSGVYGAGGGARGAGGQAPDASVGASGVARTPTLKPGAESFRIVRGPEDTGRTADCMPLVPSASFGVPYQFQIVQQKDTVVILHEYPGTFRIVPTDPESEQAVDDPAWLGHSVGHWEGDTLVVDTKGFNDKTEVNGYRHTEDLHTVERFSRPESDVLQYEVTFEDPNVFTGPWTETRSFRLFPQLKKINEFVCENNRDYRGLFGKQ